MKNNQAVAGFFDYLKTRFVKNTREMEWIRLSRLVEGSVSVNMDGVDT